MRGPLEHALQSHECSPRLRTCTGRCENIFELAYSLEGGPPCRRRAVRAELKHEREAAGTAAAPARRRTLLARLVPGCIMPQAEGTLPRKLR